MTVFGGGLKAEVRREKSEVRRQKSEDGQVVIWEEQQQTEFQW